MPHFCRPRLRVRIGGFRNFQIWPLIDSQPAHAFDGPIHEKTLAPPMTNDTQNCSCVMTLQAIILISDYWWPPFIPQLRLLRTLYFMSHLWRARSVMCGSQLQNSFYLFNSNGHFFSMFHLKRILRLALSLSPIFVVLWCVLCSFAHHFHYWTMHERERPHAK